jgi:predicted HicB family RNase H-like nuclease
MKKRLLIDLDKDIHKALRIKAAKSEMSLKAYIEHVLKIKAK